MAKPSRFNVKKVGPIFEKIDITQHFASPPPFHFTKFVGINV
jgi:hypothetical protein